MPSVLDNWRAPAEREKDALDGFSFQPAPTYQGPELGPFTGALGSAVSSIPELFGAQPFEGISEWRNDNPVLSIASQLAGFAVPYAGAYAATAKIPRAAKLLENVTEGTLKAFGSTAVRSPIAAGALKEVYRYTPLELSRLGTGWALDADMGDMFADVAISQGIAGSLGGLGGFLRAGGQAIAKQGKIAEAEFGMMPNFEYRMALDPENTLIGDVDREQFLFSKQQEALKYVPQSGDGMKGRYVYGVENLKQDTANYFESLFRPNKSNLNAESQAALPIDVRQLHSDGRSWSVGAGVGEDFAQRAGYEGLSDMAASLTMPRRIVVQDARSGAAQMGKAFADAVNSGSMFKAADDTWMMKEEGGLWIVAKRLGLGAEPPKPETGRRNSFQFGPAKVREGDEWLIAKTDQPGKLAPEAAKLQNITTEQWAKYKDPFRQLATLNPFNNEMNLMMRALAPQDWAAMRQLSRDNWVSRFGSKVSGTLKAEAGLADQATVHSFAEKVYDIFAPKAMKVQKDPIFGRYYGLLESSMRFADDTMKRVMYGAPKMRAGGTLGKALRGKPEALEFGQHDGFESVANVVNVLDDVERQQLVFISNAQFPAEQLAELKKAGTLSPRVTAAAEQLQAINRHVLEKYVVPALEEAGKVGEVRWLEGYIMPRLYKGDFFQRVVDDAGRPQFIAAGPTPKAAQEMADRVIAEAKLEGKTWAAKNVESHAFASMDNPDKLDEVYKMVYEQMGQSADAQATVASAMRKLLAESSTQRGIGLPNTMRKQRTGIPGAPDVEHYSVDDVLKASENHYRQLLRYSAAHTWKHRFGDQMMRYGKTAETQYTDLQRKAAQWLGVEGQLTNTINKLVNPVLGSVLGAKSATRIAQATNSLLYAWQLGIMNPTFALLNYLTPLQTVTPWVSFMQKAPTHEAARLMQMELIRDSSGKVAGTAGVLAPLKVLHEATKLMGKPTDELKEMFERALSDGVVAPQLYDEFVGPHSGQVFGLKQAWAKSGWDFIKETATVLSTRSEQFSRLTAFNSAYVVGKDLYGLSGDKLYRFTRKATETTMYGYGVMDRSRVLTGPIGSSWGLFKNWQFHFIGNMAQYAGLAVKDKVWGPLLWQGAAATSLGGLAATPLIYLADGLAKWNTDSPNSYHYLAENWQGPAGDAVYFGLPSLLGISLQASSSLPGTDIVQDVEGISNAVLWQKSAAVAKAAGGAFDLWQQTGTNPLKDPKVRDQLMGALAPRAAFRAYSVAEGDYVKSMATGSPTVRDLPASARMLHGMGFNALEIEKNYIAGEYLYEKQQKKRDVIQNLGHAFASARIENDRDAMSSIVERAITSGVPVASVIASADTRYRREMVGDHLSRFDRQDQAEWNRLLNGGL